MFRDFPNISRTCIFFCLSLSFSLFYSSLLCFSSLHIVGSLTSKPPLVTKYYNVLLPTTKYYPVLQGTTKYHPSTTKCYPVLLCWKVAAHETSSTLRGATYGMQNTMELRHSCLIVATHEKSFTLRGATYEMPNTMELRHSCLIVAAHKDMSMYIARDNLWDAKHPGTATFIFDSRNT